MKKHRMSAKLRAQSMGLSFGDKMNSINSCNRKTITKKRELSHFHSHRSKLIRVTHLRTNQPTSSIPFPLFFRKKLTKHSAANSPCFPGSWLSCQPAIKFVNGTRTICMNIMKINYRSNLSTHFNDFTIKKKNWNNQSGERKSKKEIITRGGVERSEEMKMYLASLAIEVGLPQSDALARYARAFLSRALFVRSLLNLINRRELLVRPWQKH